MNPKPNDEPARTATDDFEGALRALVLESFAAGARVEGRWDLSTSSSVVPEWRVTIEKTGGATPPTDDAVFLDE